MNSFKWHPQYWYTQNVKLFKAARLMLYADNHFVTIEEVANVFKRDFTKGILITNLRSKINKIQIFNPDICVITATYNRGWGLERIFKSLIDQHTNKKIDSGKKASKK